MRVAVVGAGRVGVPTAVSLAEMGHEVVAVDTDRDKVDRLASGIVPFFEPGLEDLLRRGLASGRLRFVVGAADAVGRAGAVLVCVGTPPGPTGETDLSTVEAAVRSVGGAARGPLTVAVKSTVPPGTGDRVAAILREVAPAETAVVSNPEFLREGRAVEDSMRPLRVLVGTDGGAGAAVMRELYAPVVEGGATYIETDRRTAEVAKHACNAFLALKVSYVNALARVCEAAGADVVTVTEAMAVDPRIGGSYLAAGLGYGGYCLPKDVRAFERSATALGYDFALLREVERINEQAVDAAVAKVGEAVGDLGGARVALLGLAFKPETDNVTGSPALALALRLVDAGAAVTGYDPQAGAGAKAVVAELDVSGDPYAALEGADCAVVCTEWDEIRGIDLHRARTLMARPVLVDGRNAIDPRAAARAGFRYVPTGRPATAPPAP